MTYRDDAEEIATLRQELAVSEAACATAMAEVEALKADLAKAKLRVGEHDEACPQDHPAPTWQGGSCVKPRGHDVHWNGYGDVWVPDLEGLVAERDEAIAELDRLRTAVRSVLAMVDHGTALPALMHAVVGLRRFVEPEVGT